MEKESQTIFDKNVIEFVTVAAEFCAFLERAERMKRSTFVDTSLKILPLLYLKASMLPKCETIGDEALETYVTEEIYEILRINLSGLMADKDDYLDVFVQDMVYSDQPIKKSSSINFLTLGISALGRLYAPQPSKPMKTTCLALSFPLALQKYVKQKSNANVASNVKRFCLFMILLFKWLMFYSLFNEPSSLTISKGRAIVKRRQI